MMTARGTVSQLGRLALCMTLVLASSACDSLDNCPAAQADITIETGITNHRAGTYSSAPSWGPRDPYPAKTTLHFIHDLRFTPDEFDSYVSFTAEGSDFSENTGNQARWKCIDDHEIVLKNDTCEDGFYVFVTASGAGDQHNPCSCAQQAAGECPTP